MNYKKVTAEIIRHGSLILGIFFIAASILSEYNPGMMFLTNNTSLILLRVFCLFGIISYFVRMPPAKKE